MDKQTFYSVRMHASAVGKHISGAERIVGEEQIREAVSQLIDRAIDRGCRPDQISVKIDQLTSRLIRIVKALDVFTIPAVTISEARNAGKQLLLASGVSEKTIEKAIRLLSAGTGPDGQNMRGAMIMDSVTGDRYEPDTARGVRASRFDWGMDAGFRMRQRLEDNNLSHFRTYEAVALATKIAHGPGVIAELCWSDDADYTAGYVASLSTGYVRFPVLKEKGDAKGGRALFVNSNDFDLERLIEFLENEPVLMSEPDIIQETILEKLIAKFTKHV